MMPKEGFSQEYLFCLFSSEQFRDTLASLVTGTSGSHQRVRPEGLMLMDTVIPDGRTLELFAGMIKPFIALVNDSILEIQNLQAVRDLLLPRLMSGKIRTV